MNFERLLVFTVLLNIMVGIGFSAYMYSKSDDPYGNYAKNQGQRYIGDNNSLKKESQIAAENVYAKDVFANAVAQTVFGVDAVMDIPKLVGMVLTVVGYMFFPIMFVTQLIEAAKQIGVIGNILVMGIIVFEIILIVLVILGLYNKIINRQT